MSIYKRTYFFTALFIGLVLLSGCSLLPGGVEEKIDPPQTVIYTDEGLELEEGEEQVEQNEKIMTELYLFDKNGYVVPQTFPLPKTESVATQALRYLVKDGPVTEILPNGFSAVLPVDTDISVDIQDGTAIVNFSNEFKNYAPEDELKILQSITYTLTQFDTIDKVKLRLNGHDLEEMPVAGTPIGEYTSRKDGINIETNDVVDITHTVPATVYYIAGHEGNYYYVPVTTRVKEKTVENIVSKLVSGPSYFSPLLTDFLPDVALIEEPTIEDGIVTLNFNEYIYNSFEEKVISQHLLNTLVLSLTEQEGIEGVAILVNGEAELVNEKGEKLVEPVMRPQKVNTGSF